MRKGIQIAGMLAGVLLMGFSISWLVPCGFGTDAFTAMNLEKDRNQEESSAFDLYAELYFRHRTLWYGPYVFIACRTAE